MACLFEMFLPARGRVAVEAATAALDEVDRLEAQLTVYDDASEVSRMNRSAWRRPVRIRRNLFDLLKTSAELTEQTDGAFDVTTGALIKSWGFFRGPRRVPAKEEIDATLERVGMQHITLDEEHGTVHYDRRGLEINLGAIGKGYAIDRAAAGLVKDLKQRGMFDDTLVIWGGEFGRTVYSQGRLSKNNHGRDHHGRSFTMWMAGSGIKRGFEYGKTDTHSYNILENPVHIRDFNATIQHLLGIDHNRLTFRYQGLDQRLTGVEPTRVVHEILA